MGERRTTRGGGAGVDDGAGAPERIAPRSLLLLVGAVILLGSMYYGALTPLLPEYAERFDLSKTGAGVLAGSYAAGALVGALPSAWLAVRLGSRRTLFAGLVLDAVSTAAFAFGDTIVVLDVARFATGLGSACTWAGGMGWLIATTSPTRRGVTIGNAMSAAVIGFLLGPLIGAIARATGPEAPFAAIAMLAALLALATLRLDAAPGWPATRRADRAAFADPRIRVAAWMVLMSALAFGCVEVLVPLELDRLGAGGLAIGAAFLAAAAAEGVAQPLVGRATDRHGRIGPIRVGLAGMLASLLLMALPQVAWLLIVATVVVCVMSGVVNTPAMTLLSDGVEGLGLDQGVGFAIVYFVWAGGQVAGSAAGGLLAAQTTDATVYAGLAAVCGLTLASIALRERWAAVADRRA